MATLTAAAPLITSTLNDITVLTDKKHETDGLSYVQLPKSTDTRKLTVTKEDLTVYEPVTPEKVIEKLRIYGGCFVRNYLPKEDCEEILKDLEPHFNQFQSPEDIDNFISSATTRVSGTCVKSRTAANKFLAHPLNIAVSNAFLGKENVFRIGDEQAITGYSPAQHNSCITFRIRPGSENQPLHRDDMLHHNIRKSMEEYEFGVETAVGTVLALKKATKENGATRFIPGSHLWDHYRQATEEETVYAELDVGDCFFMLASCYHGGSANITKDEERIVTILFMTQGTLRQEENIFLGTSLDYFKSLSLEALKAIGLTISQPFCGWVENDNAIYALKPDEKDFKYSHFSNSYHIV